MLAATVSRAHFGLLFIPNNAHKHPPPHHPHPPTQIKPLWRRPPRSRVRLSAPLSHIMPINNRYWQRVAMATARCPRVLARQRKVARHTLVPSLTVSAGVETGRTTDGTFLTAAWTLSGLIRLLLFPHTRCCCCCYSLCYSGTEGSGSAGFPLHLPFGASSFVYVQVRLSERNELLPGGVWVGGRLGKLNLSD